METNNTRFKITPEEIEEIYYGNDKVLDEIVGEHRWHLTRRVVFVKDGLFYEFFYETPATEIQEVYDGLDVEKEVTQVFPREVTVTKYFTTEE